MLIVFFILYLTYLPQPSAGAIWTRLNPTRGELREFARPNDESMQAEFKEIFPDHALAQAVNKPDCFRRATSDMQQRCADLEDLEEEKISFAVSMTLCELEVAHLSPPMECQPIKQKATVTPMKRRRCVEALARSAQSWSSYSGYFRESTRMCYAYQQLNDVDVAKNIYQNITGEKMRFVRFLLEREQNFQKNDQRMSTSIESMHEILGDLSGFTALFDSVTGNMTELPHDIMKYITVNLDETLVKISRHQAEQQTRMLLEMETGVSRLFAAHGKSLERAIETLGSELSYHSQTLRQQVRLHDQELSHVMNQVNGQWNELIGGISTLYLSISQASQAADRVGEQLQAHWEETAASYTIQLAATKNAEQLATALGNLTFTTQAELQQINNTTLSIRDNLLASRGRGARIWYSILLNAFRIIGREDLPGYHQVSEHLIFRIITTAGHFAWSTTWFLLSAMMSVSLLPLRHLLFKPRKSPGGIRSAPPFEVENVSYAVRYETSRSSLYPLSSSNDHLRPQFYYGKPRHRLRLSLIPERLVRMPVDSV